MTNQNENHVDVNKNDFETLNDIIPFWDFNTSSQLIGVFMGEGKEVGDGSYTTKTWLFNTEGGEFLVPQWAMLNDLHDVEPDRFVYRITYRGKYERADGGKFHQLKLERKTKSGSL
jgi:hypothetical protein